MLDQRDYDQLLEEDVHLILKDSLHCLHLA